MTIACPGCGREYDAEIFRLGRTIHCACGRRVGPEDRPGIPVGPGAPRFIADAMLGRLARTQRMRTVLARVLPRAVGAQGGRWGGR